MDPTVTILFVDDEPLVRQNAAALLKAGNYRVVEAADGLDAVAKYEDYLDEIALVIMDMAMPRLGGLAAAKKIKAINYFTKIIFISGNTLQAPPEELSDGFLTKPLRGRELLATVQRVLREKKVQGPHPEA